MTLKQAKPLVNPTLQVITSRKDKNMPKTNQAKRKVLPVFSGRKKRLSMFYQPTYKQMGIDYQRFFDKDGVEFEMNVFYRKDEHMLLNPPDMTKLSEGLKKLLKGSGIGKITITFMDKNL